MCGIAGVYNQRGGSASLEIAKAMGATMTHRGPDNFGFAKGERISMAHNRLSLLDLSEAANQPFKKDRYLLAYNGEIYNFKQIRSRLERDHDLRFATTSDTEVLFYSLIHDGVEKCLREINGMFAFAFYDGALDRLYLARDRMGIKPLYYYQKERSIYWASEIKSIAKTLGLPADPVRTLHATNNSAEKSVEHTLFKGLFSVNPGCYLTVGADGEPRSETYYDVVDDVDPDLYHELKRQPAPRVVMAFDKLFNESVERMLISDAPVGAFVSGGIDSSLISSVATKYDADIKLFTANVIGKYSEFPDVEILSNHLKKPVFDYKFEPEMVLRDWVDVTYYYDCPIVIHVNSIPFSNVARLARNTGVKAVLTGEGSDELFLGYPRLLTKRYESLASLPVRAVRSLYGISPKLNELLFPDAGKSPLAFINKLVQGFELTETQERANERLGFLASEARREQLLTLTMVKEHLVTLLHRNDRMGMMSSIEARFPFLDEPLVKFAINLPAKFKIRRTPKFHNYKHPFLVDKWIVRKAAEKYLPKELVNKKKNGFPMFGHKFIRINDSFFADGWLADSLGLKKTAQEYMVRTQDPYFVAKLASVEIFGRIYSMGQSLEDVKKHVIRNAQVQMN